MVCELWNNHGSVYYLDSHHTRGGYEISHTNFTYTFISIILTTSHICFICSVVCELCPIYKDKILEKQVRLRRTLNCGINLYIYTIYIFSLPTRSPLKVKFPIYFTISSSQTPPSFSVTLSPSPPPPSPLLLFFFFFVASLRLLLFSFTVLI